MLGEDVRCSGQVGDGAGEPDHAGAGSGGQAHALDEALQQCLAGRGEGAEQFRLAVVHGCIAEDVLSAGGEPVPLHLTGPNDTRGNLCTGLSGLPVHKQPRIHS